tara:strand:+ start:63 stop:581 length:519 start_codon:yes stop_codon:yes gene_type:complete
MSGTVETKVEIYGLKNALKELNKVDKVLRREITKDYKRVTMSLIQDAESAIPLGLPLSGMGRTWTPTKGSYQIMPWPESHNIKASINTKNIKEYAGQKVNLSTFVVKWSGGAAQVFDFAESGNLGNQLTRKYGKASRVMWRAYEKNKLQLDIEMEAIVNKVANKMSMNLAVQ